MKIKLILFLFVLQFPFFGNAQNDSICKKLTTKSVHWMNNNESIKLYHLFDETVASKLDAKTTESLWKQITSQYGTFIKIDTVYSNSLKKSMVVVDCILSFKKGRLKYRLTFNDDNRIAGIFFIPYKTKQPKDREPQETNSFKERKTTFINDSIEFPAMYCIPQNQEIIAIAVLVHGSGPNDMDETIGPNKIFQQLAHKLAENGIASLRYDKRTYIYKNSSKDYKIKTDIDNVVVNDAVKAIEIIKQNDSFKNLKTFVIGHSLGANLSPRIAQKSKQLDGIILMAGNSRPLEDLVVEQYKYLYARGGYSKVEKDEIKKITKQAKNVKKLEKNLKKNPNMKLNLPLTNDTAFWLSISKYNPIETSLSIATPMLILQGARDYQVTKQDFDLWHKELHARKDVFWVYYSTLNHLFMEGKGDSYPEEYNHKGNISKEVISDISNWIMKYSNKPHDKVFDSSTRIFVRQRK